MVGPEEPLQSSRFNIYLPWRGQWLVLNARTGRAALPGLTTIRALKDGHLSGLPPPRIDALARLGLVVPDGVDETGLISRHPSWPQRTADVTFVTASASGEPSEDSVGLKAALDYIRALRRRNEVDVAKFRLCGWADQSITARRRLLQTARAAIQEIGIAPITMWMTDDLREARQGVDEAADAFFLRWDLRDDPAEMRPEGAAWKAVLDLVERGRSLIIQVAAAGKPDLERHADTLRWVARQRPLVRGGGCLWDLAVAGEDTDAYFLPSLCLEDIDPDYEALPGWRLRLAELGIPVRPAISPYGVHPGCAFRWDHVRAFGSDGTPVACLMDLRETRTALGVAIGVEEQIRHCGTTCCYVPFCAARCPRLGPLEPGSERCEARKHHFEQELLRLLDTGQLPIANLGDATSPPAKET